MKKIFRIIVAVPCWVFLQSIGTFAFTLFLMFPILGLISGVGYLISYLGTGNKRHLDESFCSFEMLITLFGGTLTTYSWIQTGDFDMDNYGMTHLEK